MNDIFKKLEEISKAEIVDRSWMAKNKSALLSYIKTHPILKPQARLARTPTLWGSLFRSLPAAVLVAFVLMASAGGISLASQESIPGDFLYPWKVGIESIESAFLVSSQNRAEFEVERTTERLKEITELAVQKKLNTEVAKEAHAQLQKQVEITAEAINKVALEDTGKALETATQLDATLQAHKGVLSQLQTNVDSEVGSQVNSAIDAITKTSESLADTIETLTIQNKEELTNETSESDLKTDATNKLAEVQKTLDEKWGLVIGLKEDSVLRVDTEDKLSSAQEALWIAERDLEAGLYADAILDVQVAKKLILDAMALLDATQEGGSTVKDILVEVTPTPTPTPSPTPTSIPTISATPTPTQEPVQTPTPTPTEIIKTPTPTPSPTPSSGSNL